jgi:ribosomal protein S18 acetylase RimI-like enzyme
LDLDAEREKRRWRCQIRAGGGAASGILVAEAPEQGVVGFGSCGLAEVRHLGHAGEIFMLYVDDAYHGQGLGRRLIEAMFAHLGAGGVTSVLIWVLGGNPARYFYEAIGGKRIGERTGSQWGVTLREIAYGWTDINQR